MSDETRTHAPHPPGAGPVVPDGGGTASGGNTDPGPSDAAPGTVVQSPDAAARAAVESAAGERTGPAVAGYEVLGELGRGAMGVVYKARQVGLNRPVALKMVLAGPYADAGTRARFLIEAEAVAALEHPHVVRVFAFGEHDGFPYLAMEYLPGGSLADRLKAGGPLPPREAAAVVAKLAGAVAQAHARGVVHRDIKPANVMLAADGSPRLTDFGLAKVGRSDLTGTGAVLGTPAYMSPEQAAGRVHEVGPAADVYALGALLYDLLTGRPPFRGDSIAVTLQQVLTVEPGRPRALNAAIPRDLETVCLKCLEKEPAKRYPSAQALVDDLERVLAGEPVKARRAGTLERGVRWARRNRVAVGIALLIGGLSVALGVVATRPKPEPVLAPEPVAEPPAPAPAAPADELFAVVEELDRTDPGWRIEQLDRARRTVLPAANSAASISLTVAALPASIEKQFVRFNTANDALAPTVPLPKEFRQEGADLFKPRLVAARLSGQPYGRFPVDWNRGGLTTILPHGQQPRTVAALLRWSAVSAASGGDADAGLVSCRACVNAGRSLHDEPSTISQLVRIACGTLAVQTAGRVLALGAASEKELVALAESLQQEDLAPLFEIMARSERAMAHRVFTVVTAGDELALPADLHPDEAAAFARIPKGQAARTAHVWSLKHYTWLVAISKTPTSEQAAAIVEWVAVMKRESPPGAREVIVAADKIGAASRRYTALVRSAIVALALERYRLANGRWPDKLTDLVPIYLPAVPTDPEDAAPLRYRRLADGAVVYGVGTDGKDDGGAITPPAPEQKPADIGFRLWNAELRGKGKPDDRKN